MTTSELYSLKENCCGCSMCASECPAGIISMVSDEEGFLYPQIENEAKCIHCSKCISVCPLKKEKAEDSSFEKFYAGSINIKEDLTSCSSGGIATDIARGFVRKGGVVYGASYSSDWKTVEYIRCDSLELVERLKTSKYSQAEKKDIFRALHIDLQNEIRCLFIGLPCDVAAVANRFNKYANLYTIELICHGPTSNKVNSEYCTYLEQRYGSEIDYFSTRYKKKGKWKPFFISAHFKNGKTFLHTFHESEYGAAFRYLKRPSCYSCPIKGAALKGDMMLGDYHYVEKGMKGYNPHGVSSVLLHNKRGEFLLGLCENSTLIEIDAKGALANRAIFKPIEAPKDRKKFQHIFVTEGIIKAGRLAFVKRSNTQRMLKSYALGVGVKVKRMIMPSTRPHI